MNATNQQRIRHPFIFTTLRRKARAVITNFRQRPVEILKSQFATKLYCQMPGELWVPYIYIYIYTHIYICADACIKNMWAPKTRLVQ